LPPDKFIFIGYSGISSKTIAEKNKKHCKYPDSTGILTDEQGIRGISRGLFGKP
jgi:hypothetical protein